MLGETNKAYGGIMSELFARTLAKFSAPAICGIKSSNLLSISKEEFVDLKNDIEEINNLENHKIRIFILKETTDRMLILVFQPFILESYINERNNKSFLINIGYSNLYNLGSTLNHLKLRINNSSSFPHEIGIFLGYDICDVKAFIEHKTCLYQGPWKIYSNVEEKKKIFAQYEECTNKMLDELANGHSLYKYL